MNAWVAQVAAAIAAVPHAPDCMREIGCAELDCIHGRTGHACTCDREQRIAERVAAALETASKRWYGLTEPTQPLAPWQVAALRALGEGTP